MVVLDQDIYLLVVCSVVKGRKEKICDNLIDGVLGEKILHYAEMVVKDTVDF